MAVLPGAMIGELLERLNAERRRVVLDGFEPHADEWSRTWSQRSDPRGNGADGPEVEVLDRIADDLRIEEPGQPTAAEVVVILTSAIRRAPDRAAIIVDAMLVDYPKMAVVIVATALRACPGLRKEILATARRHKPFSRHPFILGILLAVVAKILADHGAEAAEPFQGLEAPSEILAALGRHYATARPPSSEAAGRAGDRAAGFGPLVTPAFVATVMVAGDAWSRTPAAGDEPGSGAEGAFKVEYQGEPDATAATAAADQLDGGPAEDGLRAARAETPEDREAEAAPFLFQADRSEEAGAAAAPLGEAPRTMGALAAADEVAPSVIEADTAAPTEAAAEGDGTPADGVLSASDDLFDLVLQKVAGTEADPIWLDAPLRDLADMLAAGAADAAAEDTANHVESGAPPVIRGGDEAAPTQEAAIAGSDTTPADGLPDPDTGAVTGTPVTTDAAVLGGEEGHVAVDLDTGLALGTTAAVGLETGLGLLDEGKLAGIEVDLAATVADMADLGTSANLDLFGENGLADVDLGAAVQLGGIADAVAGIEVSLLDQDTGAKVETAIETSLAGAATFQAKTSVGILDGGTAAKAEAEIDTSVAGVAKAEGSASLEVGGDGLADAALDAGAQVADVVAADAAVDIALLDAEAGSKVEAGLEASAAGIAAAEVQAGVALTDEDGASVELHGEVGDELLSVDIAVSSTSGLAVELDLLPEDKIPIPMVEKTTAAVEAIVGGLLGGKPEAEDPPPAAAPVASHPVPSILDALSLFG